MDKEEYRLRTDEMKALIKEGRYPEAARIADSIDWRRVKNTRMLCLVGDLYKKTGHFDKSRDVFLLVYEIDQYNESVVYSLCELSIKRDDFLAAIEYMKGYARLAPGSAGVYVLRYKLYEQQGVSCGERAELLEELKSVEFKPRWAYELVTLYNELGDEAGLISACDYIYDNITSKSDMKTHRFCVKALELKEKHTALTASQSEYLGAFRAAKAEEEARERAKLEAMEAERKRLIEEKRRFEEERAERARRRRQEREAKRQEKPGTDTIPLNINKNDIEEDPKNKAERSRRGENSANTGEADRIRIQESELSGEYETSRLERDIADGIKNILPDPDHSQTEFTEGNSPEIESGSNAGNVVNIRDMRTSHHSAVRHASRRYDSILSQGGDGQISLVLPEKELIEEQITGQISIDDIMERIKAIAKENKEARVEQIVHGRTDGMFKSFERKVKEGPQAEIDEMLGIGGRAFDVSAAAASAAAQTGAAVHSVIKPNAEKAAAVIAHPAAEGLRLAVKSVVVPEGSGLGEGEGAPVDIRKESRTSKAAAVDSVTKELPDLGDLVTESDNLKKSDEKKAPEGFKEDKGDKDEKETSESFKEDKSKKKLENVKASSEKSAFEETDTPEEEQGFGEGSAEDRKNAGLNKKNKKIDDTENPDDKDDIKEDAAEDTEESIKGGEDEGLDTKVSDSKDDSEHIEEDIIDNEDEESEENDDADHADVDEEDDRIVDKKAEVSSDKALNEDAAEKENDISEDDISEDSEEINSYDSEDEASSDRASQDIDEIDEKEMADLNKKEPEKEESGDEAPEAEEEKAEVSRNKGSKEDIANKENADSDEDKRVGEEPEEDNSEAEEESSEAAKEDGGEKESEATKEEKSSDKKESDKQKPKTEKENSSSPADETLPIEKHEEHAKEAQEHDALDFEYEPLSDEQIQERLSKLTEAEKQQYGYILHNHDIAGQIFIASDILAERSKYGVCVVGKDKNLTLDVAKGIVRTASRNYKSFTGKAAKISGSDLKAEKIPGFFKQLHNGALIITDAGSIRHDSAKALANAMNVNAKYTMVLLTGSDKSIRDMLNREWRLDKLFDMSVDTENIGGDDSLVAYGREYAREQEYSIDNLGILALHTRIEELQTFEHKPTPEDVKKIVDEAIEHSSKKGIGHLVEVISRKRYDDEDMIILREKDFLIDNR